MKKATMLLMLLISILLAQYPKDVIATSYPEGESYDIESYLDNDIYVIVMYARTD